MAPELNPIRSRPTIPTRSLILMGSGMITGVTSQSPDNVVNLAPRKSSEYDLSSYFMNAGMDKKFFDGHRRSEISLLSGASGLSGDEDKGICSSESEKGLSSHDATLWGADEEDEPEENDEMLVRKDDADSSCRASNPSQHCLDIETNELIATRIVNLSGMEDKYEFRRTTLSAASELTSDCSRASSNGLIVDFPAQRTNLGGDLLVGFVDRSESPYFRHHGKAVLSEQHRIEMLTNESTKHMKAEDADIDKYLSEKLAAFSVSRSCRSAKHGRTICASMAA